jgi:hypothetical protein
VYIITQYVLVPHIHAYTLNYYIFTELLVLFAPCSLSCNNSNDNLLPNEARYRQRLSKANYVG